MSTSRPSPGRGRAGRRRGKAGRRGRRWCWWVGSPCSGTRPAHGPVQVSGSPSAAPEGWGAGGGRCNAPRVPRCCAQGRRGPWGGSQAHATRAPRSLHMCTRSRTSSFLLRGRQQNQETSLFRSQGCISKPSLRTRRWTLTDLNGINQPIMKSIHAR